MIRYAKRFALASCAAVACAWPAMAQVPGVYTGTSSDGNSVSFTVSQDSSGNLAVTSATIFYTAPCNGGGPVLSEGEGFGLDTQIVSGRGSSVTSSRISTRR